MKAGNLIRLLHIYGYGDREADLIGTIGLVLEKRRCDINNDYNPGWVVLLNEEKYIIYESEMEVIST